MALPVDPRMRKSSQQAQSLGLSLPAQAPGTEFKGAGLNYGQSPWGPSGAPTDLHQYQHMHQLGLAHPAGGMAMGHAGMASPGPGMAYPGTPGAPPSPFSPPAISTPHTPPQPAANPLAATAYQSPQKRPIDLGNALFQGAQPGHVAGKPAWVDGPEKIASAGHVDPYSLKNPGLPLGPENQLARVSGKPERDAMQAAQLQLSGPARKAYLNSRKATVASRQNGTATSPKQIRMARKAEAQQRGFEMNLGLANPGAYAALQQGRGAQSMAGKQFDAQQLNIAENRKFQGSENKANRESRERVADATLKANLASKGVDPSTGQPVDVRTPAEKIEGAEKLDLSGKTDEERKLILKDLPPETQDRLLNQARKDDLGFLGQPVTPPLGPMRPGISRGEAANNALHGIFGVKPGEKVPQPVKPKKTGKWGPSPFPPFYVPQ